MQERKLCPFRDLLCQRPPGDFIGPAAKSKTDQNIQRVCASRKRLYDCCMRNSTQCPVWTHCFFKPELLLVARPASRSCTQLCRKAIESKLDTLSARLAILEQQSKAVVERQTKDLEAWGLHAGRNGLLVSRCPGAAGHGQRTCSTLCLGQDLRLWFEGGRQCSPCPCMSMQGPEMFPTGQPHRPRRSCREEPVQAKCRRYRAYQSHASSAQSSALRSSCLFRRHIEQMESAAAEQKVYGCTGRHTSVICL